MAYWHITKPSNVASTSTLLKKTSKIQSDLETQIRNLKSYLESVKMYLDENALSVDGKSFEPYFDKIIEDLDKAKDEICQAINSFEVSAREFADKTEQWYANYQAYVKKQREKAKEQENIQHHYDFGNIG